MNEHCNSFMSLKNELTDINAIEQYLLNSQFGIAVYRARDMVLVEANQVWLNRLDEPFNNKSFSVGKPVNEIITGWKGSAFEKIWNIAVQTKKGVNLPEYRYSGMKKGISYWNISLTPILYCGEPLYIVETSFDVTETVINRNQENSRNAQLSRQYRNFETVVENMSDALFVVYPDYSIVALNQEAHIVKHFFNSFKYNSPPVNIKYYDANDNEIPYNDLPVFKIIKGDIYEAFRVTVVTREDTHHYSISGRPVYDNYSNTYFSIISIRDITSQVNNDYYLLKLEKERKEYLERVIKVKDNFLTLISHEFKTPLTVIMTAIQAMELFCGNELSDKAKRYINTIKQNTLRQFRLVRNLLDITRGTADQIRLNNRNIDIVSLTRLITESVRIYALQKELNVSFYSNVSEKTVCIDDEKYERILLNILSNAIKFTPKGKNVKVVLTVKNGYINLAVKDEGIGIPEDKLDVIFERFGQVDSSLSRQAEGSGIGLYLVKMFVEKMGGTISVKSKPFHGTTFLVRLPDTSETADTNDVRYEEGENRKIVDMMNIEFSDIYFSK
ncbi:PAS/PAC sensor signal transduction histidine kinase [Thermoclostridium stercorarium subsp. stercorarium DSM 8532]|jgi:signal transduction histidine kinase|uniref:histidine kinase n=3 Tax=Thermoclostridium stercorarium TaxID=1510 RepID=L7VMA8_THES1|nr:HAMP domain-containing sensor histidine kinase [Thermoclostridium stercorarium]AGC67769.1 PAS/PAC sensor signal transduction histidine kinase [Thermoclostridium stercorarium subsp. stercorarium DSM 8532]AGI38812.1 histidine kinase [Thermoclostridium stercorarium subsp. stercorarium DSM 8532]ANX00716.1 histidine kinase [Thermoclostridium stercorarium subsp. leptospartum DSM 9219]UZQ86333.1 HAMP domain-containing histidine kinase [Thermoclostridium stercorarium]